MEILFEPCSPVVHMPAHRPRPWLMSLAMYNDLAPWFGHAPIPPAPLFPATDKFLTNYGQTNNQMTEQSLIEYAKAGDQGAIDYLGVNGFEGVDWKYAITKINGCWLPGNEIVLVWNEMVKVHQEKGLPYEEIKTGLQAALDGQHANAKTMATNQGLVSPAGRPWHFQQQHALKWGQRGTNRTQPKKKRK